MHTTPLALTAGHLFVTLDGGQWLLDTGAPTNFGASESLAIGGTTVSPPASYMGLDTRTLTDLVGTPHTSRFFFDTGAQVSYFQDDAIADHPAAGRLTDFYPGFGQFETDTHNVPITLAGVERRERCGRLPGPLGMTLMLADVQGILGNALLRDRAVGYFPRRRTLVL